MRNLFTACCAALISAYAWGAPPIPSETLSIQGKNKAFSNERSIESRQTASRKFSGVKSAGITGLHRLPQETRSDGAGASDYDGKYVLTLCDDVFDEGTGTSEAFEVEVRVIDGVLSISGSDIETFEAAFDDTTGTATFSNQYLGASSSYAYSYITLDLTTENLFSSFTAKFNDDASALIFPEGAGFLEGAWTWSVPSQKNAAIQAAQEFNTGSSSFVGWIEGRTFVAMTKGEMTFSSAGKATYYDGLMMVNQGVDQIYSWEIEVEKCNEVDGLYRMRPYSVSNPVGIALGKDVDTETTILINAANVRKVFTKGDFTPYGLTTFCGVNLENNFNATNYGTFSDGVIEFPDKSFAYQDGTTWYLISSDGQPNLSIVFEGAFIKDFTLEASVASQVSKDNKWTVNLTKGKDVASVKYMVLPMAVEYSTLSKYGIDIDTFGTEAEGNSILIDPVNNNLFDNPMTEWNYVTVFLASYNDQGMKKQQTSLDLVVLFADEEEGWSTVGETDFIDPFIAPMFGEEYTKKVEVQAKSDNTPVYRLVLPYSNYPADVNLAGLTTSMVIDATDPTWVEIPAYCTGVEMGYGITAVGSVTVLGYDKASAPEDVGTITLDGNVVTLSPKSAFLHLPLYSGPNEWLMLSSEGSVVLPAIKLSVTVKNDKGEAVEDASLHIKGAMTEDAKATEEVITTDSRGNATLEVPFSFGYFGEITLYVNNTEHQIKLNGASTNVEIVLSDSAVSHIEADESEKVVYDIQGHRISTPSSGLNIINGRKVLVKK